ncbi:hypothetical protein KAM429_39430 [Aquipseudomonas alcaligenes]|uniref:Uncharacterized protein n=1 Tax=Aquipseudomonas alcaligenes TaxID=43263 RepID=A0AA37FQH3_AQUAC|nr:hypothetical protein KAM426_37810 [Pseudomonas alcaligenes]GIZ68798.1 hypothetical protein KAM428_38830 [Pseudomonas alcaligenes]GIZ73182.1 hypothetical protein KAM429_39430 [Pseudomonas alcaligenes]GIZ77500.1 hypothetical protein KAM430_39090 [Pseudomonas alcaligenes]GIZ81810.1 hypothetical protein KAM432_38580 [Pseudomonas alcaligenes]
MRPGERSENLIVEIGKDGISEALDISKQRLMSFERTLDKLLLPG